MDTKWRPCLRSGSGPIYRGLAEQICEAAARGDLRAGERLPPVRELAWELGVGPGAVSRAYRIAVDRGALEATVGRGTFVRDRAAPDSPLELFTGPRELRKIDLRGNSAPDVGQDSEFADALRALLDKGAPPLTGYCRQSEQPDFLAAVSEWLNASGVPAPPEGLLLTTGAQEALAVTLAALARGGSGLALCAPFIHPGLIECAAALGVRLEPVEADDQGVLPRAVEAAARRHAPDALLICASFNNPTLALMGEKRRRGIAEVARASDIQIIDDNTYGELLRDRPPSFRLLAPERAWHLGGFAKCVSAGLRLGFVTGPGVDMRRVRRAHNALCHHAPWLSMALGAQMIRSGAALAVLERTRAEIAARAALVDAALRAHQVRTHEAASFAMLPVVRPWTGSELAAAAAAEGVLVAPRAAYQTGRGGSGADFVRIALGAHLSRQELERGCRVLGRLLSSAPEALAT